MTDRIVEKLRQKKEILWINPARKSALQGLSGTGITRVDMENAEKRLLRFAPLIAKCFPETGEAQGIIESELKEIPQMQKVLTEKYHADIQGNLFVKLDSHLPVAGSVKARGGIYEVLKHTEELAMQNRLLSEGDDYSRLLSDECRKFFERHSVQVGSTGNLGMSIGIMSADLGYRSVVHMSADARQWKKDLLRSKGVIVKEYESDYSEAVKNGRKESESDAYSYFVDDENSKDLFLGYSVAALRLERQLKEKGIEVSTESPLFVYLPCGVGGAPGGIAFGLKVVFGDAVHCFFVEPTGAPCMLLGMVTGRHNDISVQDIGLDGQTHADGLAVGRPSGFVGKIMEPLLSGEMTVEDAQLYEYLRDLLGSEDIFLEPSACAAFQGAVVAGTDEKMQEYIEANGLAAVMDKATHIVWATGGRLVPESVRKEYLKTYL